MSVALEVKNLSVEYRTPRGPAFAVNRISFSLNQGERYGLVGESGSGKSTTVLALMRLLRGGLIAEGEIRLGDRLVATLSDEEFRSLRFSEMSLVPQGAMSSLSPTLRISEQIGDLFDDHGLSARKGERRALLSELLGKVGLGPDVLDKFPHQLSGGMKQRVCIAMAIALRPKVILADEPTSALDVMVQKQVLATLLRLQEELGAAVLLIGHDMALMAHFVDRIGIMYAGRIVEEGPVRRVFAAPRHPYTRMLIDSLPGFDRRGRFVGIPGVAPSLLAVPAGCPFHERCPKAGSTCSVELPPLRSLDPSAQGHLVACHFPEPVT
ncbi:MAG: ABC transporter ATP-binding protein [Devosia sp.]|nr:ABC transporter ATP-binding protein [Devosia sp.]